MTLYVKYVYIISVIECHGSWLCSSEVTDPPNILNMPSKTKDSLLISWKVFPYPREDKKNWVDQNVSDTQGEKSKDPI